MERLAQKNINTGEEYDRIYYEREKRLPDDQDVRRWKRLIKPFKGGSVIDLGCLDSRIFPLLKKRIPYTEFKYTGVDIAEKAILEMQKRYAGDEAEFRVVDIYDTKEPDGKYDYAVLGEVIEHMEEPEKVVKEAMRILRKGGTLALSTPHNEAVEPGAVDGERHLWSFTRDDIMELLKPYGSVKLAILGSQHFPKYVYHFPTIIAFCQKQ